MEHRIADSAGRRSSPYHGLRFYCQHFVVVAFRGFLCTHQFPRLSDWFIHERLSSSRRKSLFSDAALLKFVMKLIRKQYVIYYWVWVDCILFGDKITTRFYWQNKYFCNKNYCIATVIDLNTYLYRNANFVSLASCLQSSLVS